MIIQKIEELDFVIYSLEILFNCKDKVGGKLQH